MNQNRLAKFADWIFNRIEPKVSRIKLQESLTKDELIETTTENYPDEICEIVRDWGIHNDY